MAWTQTDLDSLESSLKAGATVVQFGDRRVEYSTIDEMLKLRAVMKAEVEEAAGTTPTRVSYATFNKS